MADIQRYLNLGMPGLISTSVYLKSDALFLAGLDLPPAKLDPSQIGLDVIFKNATKPCAWVRNPRFWIYAHPRFMGEGRFPIPPAPQSSILEINRREANLENETKHMVSIFRKISKSGATAARPHSLILFAHARPNRYPRIPDAGGEIYCIEDPA